MKMWNGLAWALPAASTASTVTASAQPLITSVGTLTSLGVTGNITAGTMTAGTITTGTKMWYYKPPSDAKKNTIIPMAQKSIIHTLVEIINSVLEISLETDEILYSTLSTIFFRKIPEGNFIYAE